MAGFGVVEREEAPAAVMAVVSVRRREDGVAAMAVAGTAGLTVAA